MAMSTTAQWFTTGGPPPTYDTHSFMSTPSLRPYLQLPHFISLAWLAYPILSLAFVAFRVYTSLGNANDAIANAKNNLLASCRAAETAATSAASIPRYLAIATNDQFVDAINGSLNTAREALILALTAMEAIVNFIIDTYRSTLLCFLELIVRAALSLLLGAVDELNGAVTSVANGLRSGIQNDISSANSVIQSAIDGINKINPFSKINAPQIPVPDLSSLQNVTLPDSFTQSLNNLNNSLPTVAQLKSEIESLIDKPFELLKKDINDTFSGISFNSSILPVPRQNNVLFCADMDLSVVDDLGRDIISTAKIGIILLILLALVLTGLNCLVEWYKWGCLKRHLAYTRQAWMSDPTIVQTGTGGIPTLTMDNHNLMMLNADSAHPLLTRFANAISKFFRLSPSKHTNLRWFFNYVFHPSALACLLIGLIGLLSVELQLLAMKPLIAKFQQRSAGAVSNFSNLIATSINNSMYNQSAVYAGGVNAQIDVVQNTLNQGVFGWVNVTTTTLNDTVNAFYNDVQKVVNTVFGKTIFASPANEFVRCFIGSKVDAVENALTFLHDNLVVNMPKINQTALVLSNSSVNEVTTPIAAAAIGGGSNGKSGLLEKIIDSYAESLRKERLMFGVFIYIWGIVVLMALCFIFWNSYGRGLRDSWRRRRFEREHRITAFDFRKTSGSAQEKSGSSSPPSNTRVVSDLPVLTPLPSPQPPRQGSRPPATPNLEDGWGKTFKERFVNSHPRKLRANGRRPVKEQLVSDPSTEVVRDLAPSTWVRRMRSLSMGSRKKEKPLAGPQPLAVDVTPSSVASTTSLPKPSRVNGNNPAVVPVPSTRVRQLLPAIPYPQIKTYRTVGATSSDGSQFANAGPRYPVRRDTRDWNPRSPTPIPSPIVGLALVSPRQQQFQQPLSAVVGSPTNRPSSPPSAWNRKVLSKRKQQRHKRRQSAVARVSAPFRDPFVTPFDDEHRVEIEHPANPIKSLKTSPLDENGNLL